MTRHLSSRSLAFLTIFFMAWLAGCITEQSIAPGGGGVDFPDPPYPPVFGQGPTISSFSPTRGIPGTTVTIVGSRFGSSPSVKVDGVTAVILSFSSTQIVARVGDATTTGKISVSAGSFTTPSVNDFYVIDIPLEGLVAFYPFEQNANDHSRNQLNGTVNGPALTVDRIGQPNSAYSFNGTGDIFVGNPPQLQINGAITVSAWIRPTDSPVQTGNIVSKFTTSGGYHFFGNGNGIGVYQLGFATRNSPHPPNCHAEYAQTFTPTADWRFITFTLQGSILRYYVGVDLVKEQRDACPLTNGHLSNFRIGNPSGGFNGLVDEVTVYNRALSQDEIKRLYLQNTTM